jgi:hypothetical protein
MYEAANPMICIACGSRVARFEQVNVTPDGRGLYLATDAGGDFLHPAYLDLTTRELQPLTRSPGMWTRSGSRRAAPLCCAAQRAAWPGHPAQCTFKQMGRPEEECHIFSPLRGSPVA